jgi:hypothetical protein
MADEHADRPAVLHHMPGLTVNDSAHAMLSAMEPLCDIAAEYDETKIPQPDSAIYIAKCVTSFARFSRVLRSYPKDARSKNIYGASDSIVTMALLNYHRHSANMFLAFCVNPERNPRYSEPCVAPIVVAFAECTQALLAWGVDIGYSDMHHNINTVMGPALMRVAENEMKHFGVHSIQPLKALKVASNLCDDVLGMLDVAAEEAALRKNVLALPTSKPEHPLSAINAAIRPETQLQNSAGNVANPF